ncbi:MAG: hypothetical protein JXQ73_17220 [Phycisphaerae bacterium]|nr:hypothetical protein [Phycisphaerae bacterium]
MEDSAFICYAESADGLKWTKPELGLVDFQGSKKNNILLRHRGSHFDSFSVIFRADWPKPEERYVLIAFVGTWPYEAKQIAERGLKYDVAPGHYAYFSADGINWKAQGDKPVVALSLAMDRTTWSWDAKRKLFLGNWKWSEKNKRCRRQAESQDLVNWSAPRTILFPDNNDPPDAEFYGHYGFEYGSQYVGWLEVYRPGPGTIDFQLVGSRDGQNWDRVADRGALIPRGAEGAFDSTMIFAPSSPPIEQGNELWIYYEGCGQKHEHPGPHQAAIGMARMREDGFVAVEAGEAPGKLITKPLVLKGSRLFANVDASKGEFRVEVVQPDGKPLPGFEAAKALPTTVDGVNSPISWQGDPSLAPGQPLRLVFHLKSARLYSIWSQ